MTLRKLAILGGGAVARALGPRLSGAGLEVLAWTRRPEESGTVGRPVTLEEVGEAEAAWLLVSDRSIAEVCGRLLAAGAPPVVLHGSGYCGTEVLEGAAARGVLHPLVSFPGGLDPDLTGAGASVSGDGRGKEVARSLASALGLLAFDLPDDPDSRARYHAAASLCANGVAALFDLGLESLPGSDRTTFQGVCAAKAASLLREGPGAAHEPDLDPAGRLSEQAAEVHSLLLGPGQAGGRASLCVEGAAVLVGLALEVLPLSVDRAAAGRALAHLTCGVLGRVGSYGPRVALTGPVPRGDAAVVAGHLAVLPPRVGEVYRLLAGRMVDLADLEPEEASAVRGALGG